MDRSARHPSRDAAPARVAPGAPPRRALRLAAALLAAAVLAWTFSLYVRPDVMLDFGQFLQLCGLR